MVAFGRKRYSPAYAGKIVVTLRLYSVDNGINKIVYGAVKQEILGDHYSPDISQDRDICNQWLLQFIGAKC